MTNFEKAQSKLRSLIWWHEYNMYLTKCIVKAYKRHCKKCPASEFYYEKLQAYKSSYRQHKDFLKNLKELQELLK